ncbi:MAG TPA: NADH-quinone oxidoreductase subunit NuoE [Bacillota bacterium]|nr:NADH-quinone oxidoreductase subunit NuoE [Bacillota bacterium]HUM55622.1 NADH-quinone oxidoreductase subunit NuoE [Bacillota bacterium]
MTCNPNEYGCGKYPELEPVLDKYADVRGSLITVLQKTQDLYGYIPVDAINHIGERIHVKPSKIYSVATFYAQFRLEPVGKYLIMLCKGTACHVNGTDSIEEAITEFLGIKDGETTEDGFFTLNNVACLGCCSLAPAMLVRSSEGTEAYGNLTKEKTKKILNDIKGREAKEVKI